MNQLTETQSAQQETLVHIISILNVTRYAAQINRHSINILMDKMDETSQDVNNLYNLATSLATSLSYHHIILYIRSVLANLRDSLSYIIKVFTHTMDYIDAATTGTLPPNILPIMDLKKMLFHIEETLPSTLHLPVSPEDTLHFYCYLCTHVLITNKQFLLLIDVPIQDWSQQLTIYKMFTLDIPHGNFTACYDVNTKYLRIRQDETMAVEISPQQFRICQEANGQFCTIPTPFQPLANPPPSITALYVKNTASISARCSLQIRKSLDISMPSQLSPSVWILTTVPSATMATITLICMGGTTKFIAVKRPIHILCLPTACSATSPLKMKAMTVAVKILTYPHHLDEPPTFTTSPVKNMHPLIQTRLCHVAEVLENHPADWYADASLLFLSRIMMMTPQWMILHLHPLQCQCSIM